jgi:hypothetical protein
MWLSSELVGFGEQLAQFGAPNEPPERRTEPHTHTHTRNTTKRNVHVPSTFLGINTTVTTTVAVCGKNTQLSLLSLNCSLECGNGDCGGHSLHTHASVLSLCLDDTRTVEVCTHHTAPLLGTCMAHSTYDDGRRKDGKGSCDSFTRHFDKNIRSRGIIQSRTCMTPGCKQKGIRSSRSCGTMRSQLYVLGPQQDDSAATVVVVSVVVVWWWLSGRCCWYRSGGWLLFYGNPCSGGWKIATDTTPKIKFCQHNTNNNVVVRCKESEWSQLHW